MIPFCSYIRRKGKSSQLQRKTCYLYLSTQWRHKICLFSIFDIQLYSYLVYNSTWIVFYPIYPIYNENNDKFYLDEINILSKLLRIYYGYEPLIMSQNINRVILTTDSILAILILQEWRLDMILFPSKNVSTPSVHYPYHLFSFKIV